VARRIARRAAISSSTPRAATIGSSPGPARPPRILRRASASSATDGAGLAVARAGWRRRPATSRSVPMIATEATPASPTKTTSDTISSVLAPSSLAVSVSEAGRTTAGSPPGAGDARVDAAGAPSGRPARRGRPRCRRLHRAPACRRTRPPTVRQTRRSRRVRDRDRARPGGRWPAASPSRRPPRGRAPAPPGGPSARRGRRQAPTRASSPSSAGPRRSRSGRAWPVRRRSRPARQVSRPDPARRSRGRRSTMPRSAGGWWLPTTRR
jgi:hypothetical protein